jgi:hypothetical protein
LFRKQQDLWKKYTVYFMILYNFCETLLSTLYSLDTDSVVKY